MAAAPSLVAGSEDELVLLAHASRSGSGTGEAVRLRDGGRWVVFELVPTDGGAGPGQTLDVYVQQSWDGANWDDVCHFTQLGGGAAVSVTTPAEGCTLPIGRVEAGAEMHQWRDGSLAAGQVVNTVVGRRVRAKWVIAGDGLFSFAVVAAVRD